MDVFPDTQLLHGGLSTRLPCKSMEQMHCPGGNSAFFFFVSWGLFHDRFRVSFSFSFFLIMFLIFDLNIPNERICKYKCYTRSLD